MPELPESETPPDEKSVGMSFELDISATTQASILSTIRAVDQSYGQTDETAIIRANPTLGAMKDYISKPAYRTNADGTRTRVRGPLADSLEDYLRATVRVGKLLWDSVVDSRTAPRDRELDGTIWEASDPSKPEPPLHPNCRCRFVPMPDNPEVYGEPNPDREIPVEVIQEERKTVPQPGFIPRGKPTNRKEVRQSLEKAFSEVRADEWSAYRSDGETYYSRRTKKDIGRGLIGSGLTDEDAVIIFDAIKRNQSRSLQLGVHPIRGVITQSRQGVLASKGDGILALNPKLLHKHAHADAKDALNDAVEQRLTLSKYLSQRGDRIATSEKREIEDAIRKLDAEIIDRQNGKWAKSTWKQGDDPKNRPHGVSEYFEKPRDRLKAVVDHEFGHQIHQTKGGDIKTTPMGGRVYSSPMEKHGEDVRKIFHEYKIKRNQGKLTEFLPSTYAEDDAFEAFAECWSAHENGRDDIIPSDWMKLIEKIEGSAGL